MGYTRGDTDKIKKLEKYCSERNLIFGIGSAEKFTALYDILKNKTVPFAEADIEKRTDPKLSYEKAESIICIGKGYKKIFKGKTDGRLRGKISMGAMGIDYHIQLGGILEEIKTVLEIDGKCFCDTGPLSDRAAAVRCGLGFAGKSSNIISEKLGSAFFIGYILTDYKFETLSSEIKKECIGCGSCIKHCPYGALSENGFDYTKCVSYITQSKHIEDFSAIGQQIYGCDICQNVCPHNKDIPYEEVYDIDVFYPDIEKLLNISNKEFRETYQKTASGWRGKKILQRNALAVLGNMGKGKQLCEKFVNDEREEIRSAALYALKKIIGGEK